MEIQDFAVYAVLLLVAIAVGLRIYSMFKSRNSGSSKCHGCPLADSCGSKNGKNALKSCDKVKKQ